MDSKSYVQLLGELADALKFWTNKLLYEAYSLHWEILEFPEYVTYQRLQILVKLGADRRDFLGELVDASQALRPVVSQ